MTRRDPAVDAARNVRRRYLESIGIADTRPGYEGATYEEIAAAREALKPIRERVEAWREALTDPHAIESVVALTVLDDLAPLIYSDDELKDNQ